MTGRRRILIPVPLKHLAAAEATLGASFDIVRSRGTSPAELLEVVDGVDGLVANGVDVPASVVGDGRSLRFIATAQVGFDRIDVAAATAAGVPVIANVGVGAGSVAEFTLGLMVAAGRRIVQADRDLRASRDWASRATYFDPYRLGIADVDGSVVGVVGLGHIGREVARRLGAAFDVEVLGFDPYVDAAAMTAIGVRKVDDLRELAAAVDFLLVHLPLVAGTRHIIGREVLAAMKPSAILVNCARGGVVDERALADALREGRLAGAAVDVFEREPIDPQNPLLDLPNVIVTPHLAGLTTGNVRVRGAELARRVEMLMAGGQPPGVVNPDVWPQYLARVERLEAAGRG